MIVEKVKISYEETKVLEIKRCKCGGNPVLHITPISHVWFVKCKNCKMNTYVHADVYLALKEWNEIVEG